MRRFYIGREPFRAVLQRVVQSRTSRTGGLTTQDVAKSLDVSYRTLMGWLEDDDRKFPAELVPELCKVLDDFLLLDGMEDFVGRIAYTRPEVPKDVNLEQLTEIRKLISEVGEALSELSRTLEEGRVEADELERSTHELNDVIRQCHRIRHWLEEVHKVQQFGRPTHPQKGSRSPRVAQP